MKRVNILLVCMIFVAKISFAQDLIIKPSASKAFSAYGNFQPASFFPHYVRKQVIAPTFYVNNLGFFCKQELKIQSFTRIPIKLRLGSVQQCDWMEGKTNAGYRPGY